MGNVFRNDEQRKHWNAYNSQYARTNYKSVNVKLSKTKDKDIIEFLENYGESVTVVFKKAIRLLMDKK